MEELKKCPFCGEKVAEPHTAHDLEDCANFEDENCPCNMYEDNGNCGYHTIVCDVNKGGFGASSGFYGTEELAIKAWNRRCCE